MNDEAKKQINKQAEEAAQNLRELGKLIEQALPDDFTKNIPREYQKEIDEALKEMNDAKKVLNKKIKDANRLK